MALATYADLQTAVADWLVRSDLAVTDLIRLAEARLSRELRVQQMVTLAEGTVAADSFATPERFLEVVSLVFLGTPRIRAEYKAPEVFFVLDAASQTGGSPQFVTVSEGRIYVGPVPSAPGTSYQLRYYAELPPLTDAAPSNWLLAKAPDVYLFASLLEAEPLLKNDARLQLWQSRCDAAVAQLNGNDRRMKAKGMAQRAMTA